DDRRVRERELLGEVAAVAGQLLDAAHGQPRALEDRLAFELIELGRDRVLVRERLGSELGIVRRPAPCGRLGGADAGSRGPSLPHLCSSDSGKGIAAIECSSGSSSSPKLLNAIARWV